MAPKIFNCIFVARKRTKTENFLKETESVRKMDCDSECFEFLVILVLKSQLCDVDLCTLRNEIENEWIICKNQVFVQEANHRRLRP